MKNLIFRKSLECNDNNQFGQYLDLSVSRSDSYRGSLSFEPFLDSCGYAMSLFSRGERLIPGECSDLQITRVAY
jgi:hypothetical protein